MSAVELLAPEIGYEGAPPALRDVRLRIGAGESVALVGGNGAGKTALLRWIAGLLPRRGGSCSVHGAPVRSARDAVARGVGLVVQDPNDQLLGATVREDVELGPRNLGVAEDGRRARVAGALERAGLAALADREIETLSLGERKRASLAGVLAMHPRVLLLDEPTAGLDPHSEEVLVDTLHQLARDGVAQLVATHAIDVVPRFASRVVVLADGRVAADGPCREVLTDDALLRRARLRRPWPVELWDHALRRRARDATLTLEEVLPCLTMSS